MRYLIIIFLWSFIAISCNTEHAQSSRADCKFKVTAIDQSGLDGCSMLLQLSKDEYLEPVEWSVEEPELKDGEKYLIDYQEIPAATICMAGKTVRITCIEIVG